MASLRESIRRVAPGSTSVYEWVQGHKKIRPTASRIKKLLNSPEPIKLDIGGGGPGQHGYTSVDITDHCDLYWDLRKGIPFPDASVDAIYSSHLLEHLTFSQCQSLLRDCLRVLKKNAPISIAVPDARIYIESYLAIREVPAEFFAWKPAMNSTTAIDSVNYIAYMAGEHQYMFDRENLCHVLELSGFVNVLERDFDPYLDAQERAYESIYAVGFKP